MLKEISALAKEFNDVEEVKAELKRVQSVKCRLKKMKSTPDYEKKMTDVVAQEQALKEVRQMFEPKKVTYTTMTVEQIAELNYDETIKAIKSVQSKKCNSQYLTDDINTNVEYQDAVKQEELLLAHKAMVKPIEDTVVKKSQIVDMIDHLEGLEEKLDKDYVLELLKGLLA
ncbi:hypothetical protein D3C75_232790 [compost metagenome]